MGKFILLISVKTSYPFLISISHFLIFLIYFFFGLHFLDMPFLDVIPRIIHRRCSIKQGLKISQKSTYVGVSLINFIRKGHQYRCFSGKSANECFCISFLDCLHKNIFRWLLLFKAIFYLKFLFTTKFN